MRKKATYKFVIWKQNRNHEMKEMDRFLNEEDVVHGGWVVLILSYKALGLMLFQLINC